MQGGAIVLAMNTTTSTCNRCGARIGWAQRKDGSWYPTIARPEGDGTLPASYWRKVGRKPHSCQRTFDFMAADVADAKRRQAEYEACAADARATLPEPQASRMAELFTKYADEQRELAAHYEAKLAAAGGTR